MKFYFGDKVEVFAGFHCGLVGYVIDYNIQHNGKYPDQTSYLIKGNIPLVQEQIFIEVYINENCLKLLEKSYKKSEMDNAKI